jgi:O-antigen ligase
MKRLIFISALITPLLFFSILSVLGLEYRGKEESSSYIIFCFSLAVLSLILFLLDYLFERRFTLNLSGLFFIFLPVIITSFFLAERPSSLEGKRAFYFYLLFSLPSSYAGIYIARRYWLSSLAKWFEIAMIIFTTAIISSLIIPFSKGTIFTSFAGDTYQGASYTSAFTYSLNLYFILFGNRHKLFKFHYFKSYQIMTYLLLIVQVMGVLISGGRGGFVLIVISTILLMWFKNKDHNNKNKALLLILIFSFITGSVLLPRLMHDDLFLNSTGRVFSYITNSGIDMTQTSDRDVVYKDAINLIKERPLTGYGFFGYYDYTFFPHNLFLEILLNWGILFLLFACLIGFVFLRKLRTIIKYDPSNLFILAIFIYPFTMLMFSGTYMSTSLFWFVFSYVFVYEIELNSPGETYSVSTIY